MKILISVDVSDLKPTKHSNSWWIEKGDYALYAVSDSKAQCVCNAKNTLFDLFIYYAKTPDDKLTPYAKQIKYKLMRLLSNGMEIEDE